MHSIRLIYRIYIERHVHPSGVNSQPFRDRFSFCEDSFRGRDQSSIEMKNSLKESGTVGTVALESTGSGLGRMLVGKQITDKSKR